MKAKTLCSMLFVAVMMLAAAPLELSAKTLGMVADDGDNDSVTVFDADTHAVLGTVPLHTSGPAIGDVLITPDLKRGFVTNGFNQLFVIDLTTSPPSLAEGTNPIPISLAGEDLSISTDGKFLIVSGGTPNEPISVVDIAAQAEISTFFIAPDSSPFSVDVCSDGSILATSNAFLIDTNTVHRLTLSTTGILSDTEEMLLVSSPAPNVYCAPGARSGVVIRRFPPGITSFTIPGLAEVDNRDLSRADAGMSGVINPSGNRMFARSGHPAFESGSIDVFDFNSTTGALGASPLLTFTVAAVTPFFGMEQIALHPNGNKLFVSEPGVLNVYDPNTGAFLASITDPNIVTPTGVTVVTQADPCTGPPPTGAIVGTNGPDQINGTSGNDTIFGLGGSDQINGRGGNDLICGGDDDDQIFGNAGDDKIVGGSGADQVTGGAGDDVLDAQDGVNGNDSVNGGAGNDVCTGDPGDALSSCNP